AEDDQDGREPERPAGRDGQPAGRDLGAQRKEEKAEHAGQQRRQRRILDRGGELLRVRREAPRPVRSRNAGHGHHTFSTSGLPSSPEGRNISTMARIEKAATSLYSTLK